MINAWRKHRARKQWQNRERVLAALARAARRGEPEVPGWPLARYTGLSGPALYRALETLESRGEVMFRCGDRLPRTGGRRRYCRLADHIDAALNELEG